MRDAVSAKEGAEAAKQAAETAQQAAAENQKNAETQAANAKASADTAAEQADAAKESAAGAANSASAAQESETNAGQSANAAANAEAAAKQAQKSAETAKTDAEAAKTAAGTSADAAAASAAEAKKTLESIPADYSALSGKVDENANGISELKEDTAALQKRQNVLVGTETGNPISVDDAFSAPLCGLTVYGKSTQDATPTPDAPVPIVSAGDGGMIAVTLSDGNGKTQTLTLPTPTGLPGVPVTSGGNYTDPQGQQWICDEVDLERGVKVQRIGKRTITPKDIFLKSGLSTDDVSYFSLNNFFAHTGQTGKKNALMSNYFAAGINQFFKDAEKIFLGGASSNSIYLSVDAQKFPDAETFKQWAVENGLMFLFQLTDMVETPLTAEEIAAYKALTAYAPNTVVQASDGAGIKLDYQRDVNLVIKNLEDAIASMTTT